MDFWRLFRLISSKRWLIAAIVVLTGLVVFAGTAVRSLHKEYQAEALMQPQDPVAANQEAAANGDATNGNNPQNPAEVRVNNISELLILLRSSNDIANRAAALLKLDEEARRKEVFNILRRNGYFAQIDADVDSQANQAVQQGDLTPAKQAAWVTAQKTKAQQALTDTLAKPTDAAGSFAGAGAGTKDSEIADKIHQIVSFESVEGPFSTDTNPQVVNQIKIIAKSPRAAEAELYANMVGVAFLDYYTNRSLGAVNARIELLKEKLASARGQYNRARDAVITFRKGNTATTLTSGNAPGANVQMYQNSLNAARQELAGYDASVKRLQELVTTSNAARTTNLPAGENPMVRDLESKVANLRIAFSRVQQSNYGTGSDVYKQAKGELDQAEAELKEAQSKPYATTAPNLNRMELESQLNQALVKRDDAQNRVTELAKQLNDQRAELKGVPIIVAKLSDLQSEADMRQDSVRRLEKALADQELAAIERGRAGTVNIVSSARAELVEGMNGGQRVKVMVYGMVLALVFSILGVVALDALDNAVKTAGDAQRLLDLSVIGQIPSHVSDLMRGPRIVSLDPLSPAAEAYRLLRTDLLFIANDSPFKLLLITPIRPGQGATTTAGNLAIALAQSGRRVILVDADMRRPKLHAIFNVSNNNGLSSVLGGKEDFSAALTPTDIENMTLMPAGPPVMNPSELVSGVAMNALLKRLQEKADFVIIDAPSPVAFGDAAVLASLADATMLVLRAGQAPDGAAEQQVRDRLQKAHANVIGMVLNDIEPERLISARHHSTFHPPLVSGSVATGAPTAIAALPGPKEESSTETLPSESGSEEGEDDDTNDGNGSGGATGTSIVRKPRIVASRLKVDAEANGAATKPTRRVTNAPLLVLFATGLSTAIGILTIALSRAGR